MEEQTSKTTRKKNSGMPCKQGHNKYFRMISIHGRLSETTSAYINSNDTLKQKFRNLTLLKCNNYQSCKERLNYVPGDQYTFEKVIIHGIMWVER